MRFSRYALLVSAAFALALVIASPANAGFTYSNSICTHKEDPQNMRLVITYAREYVPSGNYFLDPVYQPWAARDIAYQYWHGGPLSSDSYFLFSPDNGGCRLQASQTSSSLFSGWHVRFWAGTSSVVPFYGAAHHDFWCKPAHNHRSDNYVRAALTMARDFVNWNDYEDGWPDFRRDTLRARLPSTGIHCRHAWTDNGITQIVTQNTSRITTVFAG